jgi:magnesium chelatase family protein
MLAKIYGAALQGVDAFRIIIEVSVRRGKGYFLTGLPDDAIKESLGRIAIALNSLGYLMPRTKLVINLSPADIKKYGSFYDLPIAVGILKATEQLNDLGKLDDYILTGELGLDDSIYPIRETLPMTMMTQKENCAGILLPQLNAGVASLVKGIKVYAIRLLKDVIDSIISGIALEHFSRIKNAPCSMLNQELDFREVKGQKNTKRANLSKVLH